MHYLGPVQTVATLASAYLAMRPRLLRLAQRMLGCPDAAADVAQDTWLRAAASGTPPRDSVGLLLHIARNLARDRLRQRARDGLDRDLEPEAADPLANPEQTAADRQLLRRLDAAIAGLPPRCREAFVLARLEGLPHAAIAARMGISARTVENHVAFALVHLRGALREGD